MDKKNPPVEGGILANERGLEGEACDDAAAVTTDGGRDVEFVGKEVFVGVAAHEEEDDGNDGGHGTGGVEDVGDHGVIGALVVILVGLDLGGHLSVCGVFVAVIFDGVGDFVVIIFGFDAEVDAGTDGGETDDTDNDTADELSQGEGGGFLDFAFGEEGVDGAGIDIKESEEGAGDVLFLFSQAGLGIEVNGVFVGGCAGVRDFRYRCDRR